MRGTHHQPGMAGDTEGRVPADDCGTTPRRFLPACPGMILPEESGKPNSRQVEAATCRETRRRCGHSASNAFLLRSEGRRPSFPASSSRGRAGRGRRSVFVVPAQSIARPRAGPKSDASQAGAGHPLPARGGGSRPPCPAPQFRGMEPRERSQACRNARAQRCRPHKSGGRERPCMAVQQMVIHSHPDMSQVPARSMGLEKSLFSIAEIDEQGRAVAGVRPCGFKFPQSSDESVRPPAARKRRKSVRVAWQSAYGGTATCLRGRRREPASDIQDQADVLPALLRATRVMHGSSVQTVPCSQQTLSLPASSRPGWRIFGNSA